MRTTRRARSGAIRARLRRLIWRWGVRIGLLLTLWVAFYAVFPVPTTPYIVAESRRLGGGVEREWAAMSDISLHLQRAVVAAEDANFCHHWGFDMGAIRTVIADGGSRGASTITQQTVKNVFLWHGRSWVRKAIEAMITPLTELIWSKSRILEIYLNVAEFGEGIFGVEAAAQHYFNQSAAAIGPREAALLAAILPAPRVRSPAAPSAWVVTRAAAIADGAATIHADGRDRCFVNEANRN